MKIGYHNHNTSRGINPFFATAREHGEVVEYDKMPITEEAPKFFIIDPILPKKHAREKYWQNILKSVETNPKTQFIVVIHEYYELADARKFLREQTNVDYVGFGNSKRLLDILESRN